MTAEYPGAETTLLGLHTAVNNIKIAITADIDDSVTVISTSDTSNLPLKGYLTFMDGSDEIIYYGSKTLNSLTSVTRGADGSNNTAHLNGDEIEMRWNADFHNHQSEEIKAISDDNRNSFIADLDDAVTPANTASNIKTRLDQIVTQLKQITGKTDWKTTGLTTLEAEGTDTNNIKTVDLDEAATPATSATSIKDRLDQIANRLIAITGKADWKTSPADTQESLDSRMSSAEGSITTLETDTNNIKTVDLDETATPATTATSIKDRLDQISNILIGLSGKADWKTAPANTIEALTTEVSGLTSNVDLLKPTEQSTPNNTVKVSAGHFVSADGASRVSFAGGNSPAFGVVTANSRIDLLTIDDAGTLGILTGVEAASPTVPTYPSDKQVIAHVLIDETTTVVINTADITDARFFLNLGGGSTGIEYRENYVLGTAKDNYTGSLTTIDLVGSYVTGGKNLIVAYEGVTLTPGVDYTETDSNTVTMILTVLSGKQISFIWSVAAIAGDASSVDGISASTSPSANNLLALDSSSHFPNSVLPSLVALLSYRRPVLQWNSVTEIDVEINTGSANTTKIIFPDGDSREVNEVIGVGQYRRFNITETASLVATHNSGLRSGESEAANTWYALYAVKTTDDSSKFVIVGTVTLPRQANFATLNGYFGTDGWVYLGLIRNGDNRSASTNIVDFKMSGNKTIFKNSVAPTGTRAISGFVLVAGTSVTSVSYTYASGVGATQIPINIDIGIYNMVLNVGAVSPVYFSNSTVTRFYGEVYSIGQTAFTVETDVSGGAVVSGPASSNAAISLMGFSDIALGVGSNPLI